MGAGDRTHQPYVRLPTTWQAGARANAGCLLAVLHKETLDVACLYMGLQKRLLLGTDHRYKGEKHEKGRKKSFHITKNVSLVIRLRRKSTTFLGNLQQKRKENCMILEYYSFRGALKGWFRNNLLWILCIQIKTSEFNDKFGG